jgi:hypothetical protein
MFADQSGLRASDRRQAEQYAEVGCDADAPRMGNALTVDENDVRPLLQFTQSRHDRRPLAEGEISRNIGEAKQLDSRCPFDAAQLRKEIETSRCINMGARECGIDPCNARRFTGKRENDDLLAQAVLQRSGVR